jgi:hypothetical protein
MRKKIGSAVISAPPLVTGAARERTKSLRRETTRNSDRTGNGRSHGGPCLGLCAVSDLDRHREKAPPRSSKRATTAEMFRR